MCDGTFYKQSRVEKSANEACRKAYVPDGKFIPKNPWALFFKKTLVPYPGPRDLFPDVPERGVIISMTRINKGFFSPQRLGTFLSKFKLFILNFLHSLVNFYFKISMSPYTNIF